MAEFDQDRKNRYRWRQQTMDAKRKLVTRQLVVLIGLMIDDSEFTGELDIQDKDDIKLRKNEVDNLKQLHASFKILTELESYLIERHKNDPTKVVSITNDAEDKMIARANAKLKKAGLDEIGI